VWIGGLFRNRLLRFPIKFVIPAIFVVPLLAAFGTREVLCGIDGASRKIQRSLVLIGSAFLVFIF